jgi:DeoR family transcriptional regulator of aga operon
MRTAAEEREERQASYNVRCSTAPAEKRAIADAALQLLQKDQVIAMDAGTTCLYLARAIPEQMPLTIITHSAYLPVELAGRPNLQVICTGGVLQWPSLCYVGSEAETLLRRFNMQCAFLGAQGVALNVGCTDNINLLEIKLKSIMVEQARETIILADSSKLDRVAMASFARLSQVRTLITDENADPEVVRAIRDVGVDVIVAPLAPNSD